MDDIEQKIDYIQQLFNKLCQKIKSLEAEIGTGKESLTDMTQQLENERKELSGQIAKLREEGTAAADAAAAELDQQRASAEETLKQLQDSMNELEKEKNDQLAALKQEQAQIQTNADERQRQIVELKEKNATDEQKITQLESAALEMSNQLEQSRLENTTLKQEIVKLKADITEGNTTNEAKLSSIRDKLNGLKICADKIQNVPQGDYDGVMENISYPSLTEAQPVVAESLVEAEPSVEGQLGGNKYYRRKRNRKKSKKTKKKNAKKSRSRRTRR